MTKIVGVRGQTRLGRSNGPLRHYPDLGAGSSDFTWQGTAGVAYGWSRGGVQFVYRHLCYDQKNGKLLQDIRFSGPALGIRFRF